MHYFSNKFSEIANCWGAQRHLTFILVTWSYVIWSNCVFSSLLWKIEFKQISYDVI